MSGLDRFRCEKRSVIPTTGMITIDEAGKQLARIEGYELF